MLLSDNGVMDKDAIIEKQAKEIKTLREHIKLLEEKIARLQKNSSNSSKPPSSDIINPQPTNKKKRNEKSVAKKDIQNTIGLYSEPTKSTRQLFINYQPKKYDVVV